MPNDRSTSELISQSLSGGVSAAQQEEIRQQVEASEQSRRFAKISRMIQDSMSDVAQKSLAGDKSVCPGLSDDARQRMKKSIRAESARRSQIQMSATVTGDSSTQDAAARRSLSLPETTAPDSRSMTSRFTFLRKIGDGGLGSVWLARDEKLKRSVAIKEMNPEAAEFPRAWERFHREAEITGHLEHPNVVPLYQFGTDEITGQPFYAMRFVGKRTLVDAIEEFHDRKAAGEDVTMDGHRLLTAFIGVCQAIAYAHSRGVIHRDLKPENVALDTFGQVSVLDWGLAKVADDQDAETLLSEERLTSDSVLRRTMAGEIIGTPLYMAPEQAAGDLDAVDKRTDVYGLGAILFAMLTGVAPHQNSSVTENGPVAVQQLLQTIASESSPRPRDYLSGIPADLEAICMKAMQFKPHSRYQSASEVSDAVQRWMAGRNERRQTYSNIRSEGRELRTSMLSSVRDLERNVRFMSSLPPIQGIMDTQYQRQGDELSTWRERLGVIFTGLLKANCDFCSVSFAQVTDNNYQELIRIERQATDISNVRSIPISRLASGALTSCMEKTIAGHPDEVHVALSSECPQRAVDRIAAIKPTRRRRTRFRYRNGRTVRFCHDRSQPGSADRRQDS